MSVTKCINMPAVYPFSFSKEKHYIPPMKWQISTTVAGSPLRVWDDWGHSIICLSAIFFMHITIAAVCHTNHRNVDCIRRSSISGYFYCNIFMLVKVSASNCIIIGAAVSSLLCKFPVAWWITQLPTRSHPHLFYFCWIAYKAELVCNFSGREFLENGSFADTDQQSLHWC